MLAVAGLVYAALNPDWLRDPGKHVFHIILLPIASFLMIGNLYPQSFRLLRKQAPKRALYASFVLASLVLLPLGGAIGAYGNTIAVFGGTPTACSQLQSTGAIGRQNPRQLKRSPERPYATDFSAAALPATFLATVREKWATGPPPIGPERPKEQGRVPIPTNSVRAGMSRSMLKVG